MNFLIAGRVPGISSSINFEAFLQGVVIGLISVFVYRFVSRRLRSRHQQSIDQAAI